MSGYSGTNGTNGASGYSGFSGWSGTPAVGITYYPTSSASDIGITYGYLSQLPAGGAETSLAYSISASQGLVTLGQLITQVGDPSETILPRGTWTFNAYYALTGTTPGTYSTNLTHAVYKRDTGGTETLLLSAAGDTLSNTSVAMPALQATSYTITSPITLLITDRLVYRVFATTTDPDGVAIHFYYLGSEHYSNIVTGIYRGAIGTSGYSGIGTSGYSGYSGFGYKETITYSNSFNPGNVIKKTSGGYGLAQADTDANAEMIGIVEYATASAFRIVYNGPINGLSGLNDSSVYFLSDTVAGSATLVAPSSVGTISKPVFIATSSSAAIVVNMRGVSNGTQVNTYLVPVPATSAVSGRSGFWSVDTNYLYVYDITTPAWRRTPIAAW
jgi:hypothetical protein